MNWTHSLIPEVTLFQMFYVSVSEPLTSHSWNAVEGVVMAQVKEKHVKSQVARCLLLWVYRELFRHPSDPGKDLQTNFFLSAKIFLSQCGNTSPCMIQQIFAPTVYSTLAVPSWEKSPGTLSNWLYSTLLGFALSSFSFMSSLGKQKILCGMRRFTNVIQKQNCEKKKNILMEQWNEYRLIHR